MESRRMVDRFIAYQKAREASRIVGGMTPRWRHARNLVDQADRAATSMTLNISEGTTRPRDSDDRLHYYRIAWGSAVELETILDTASDRGLGPADDLARARSLASEVARILTVVVSRKPRDSSP
jgi:four helix bundle protein